MSKGKPVTPGELIWLFTPIALVISGILIFIIH